MVFADAKRVQTHLIGVLDLLDQIAQTLLWAHPRDCCRRTRRRSCQCRPALGAFSRQRGDAAGENQQRECWRRTASQDSQVRNDRADHDHDQNKPPREP
jgi:hypothetical protein